MKLHLISESSYGVMCELRDFKVGQKAKLSYANAKHDSNPEVLVLDVFENHKGNTLLSAVYLPGLKSNEVKHLAGLMPQLVDLDNGKERYYFLKEDPVFQSIIHRPNNHGDSGWDSGNYRTYNIENIEGHAILGPIADGGDFMAIPGEEEGLREHFPNLGKNVLASGADKTEGSSDVPIDDKAPPLDVKPEVAPEEPPVEPPPAPEPEPMPEPAPQPQTPPAPQGAPEETSVQRRKVDRVSINQNVTGSQEGKPMANKFKKNDNPVT